MQNENNLRIGKSSVQKLLKHYLKKTPFKMAIMQHLKPTDRAARRHFASWTQDNDIIVDSVWFSDEAHFTLGATLTNKILDIGQRKNQSISVKNHYIVKR